MPRLYSIVAALILGLLLGCTASRQASPPEPAHIAIRNESGEFIQSVTLRASGKPQGSALRYGTIAPLPVGIVQTLGRGTDAKPLPPKLLILWVDAAGAERSEEVVLQPVLRQGTGQTGETLVIEFRPADRLAVFIERGP